MMNKEAFNYQTWAGEVLDDIKDDALWRMKVYRLGLFVADLGWHDATKLTQDRRARGLADQLYRSLGSISANVAEGCSRSSKKDQARFYEYALGSARESRDWYYKGRQILTVTVVHHRVSLLTEIIRLLLAIIPRQRGRTIKENDVPYATHVGKNDTKDYPPEIESLLTHIPF
jgi:four helix bundle protein